MVEPLVPVDLIVDHSVQVDFFGTADALKLNAQLEFQRNKERYQFLKWGQSALRNFRSQFDDHARRGPCAACAGARLLT